MDEGPNNLRETSLSAHTDLNIHYHLFNLVKIEVGQRVVSICLTAAYLMFKHTILVYTVTMLKEYLRYTDNGYKYSAPQQATGLVEINILDKCGIQREAAFTFFHKSPTSPSMTIVLVCKIHISLTSHHTLHTNIHSKSVKALCAFLSFQPCEHSCTKAK